jgi:hypothetical protein
MSKTTWAHEFQLALMGIRPHTPRKLAWTIAHSEWPGNQEVDPGKAAKAWAAKAPIDGTDKKR